MLFRKITGWPSLGWETPFDELERMRRQMDLLASRLTRGEIEGPFAGVFPLMNVSEDQGHYYIRAELPGVKAEDLEISVTGDTFSVSGERKIPAEGEGVKYHRKEREAGSFSRILNLPGQINTEKVVALCVNGVLTVTLPKAEASRPKQISVKAG